MYEMCTDQHICSVLHVPLHKPSVLVHVSLLDRGRDGLTFSHHGVAFIVVYLAAPLRTAASVP